MESFYLIWLMTTNKMPVKDKTEMDCQTVAAWTRDGYVALILPIFLPSTAWVLHQDLCSKETEGEKEEKDRESHKL
jgi:hypothetical protein